jgi:hypothetical protein
MNEQTATDEKKVSAEFTAFLAAVKQNGAYVRILVEVNGEKKIENWNVNKGATDHKVTDENLIGFRPLTRKERRDLFHTPYKFGRRVKA